MSYQNHTMPFFLHDQLQLFLVKGNYMTLAVKPKAVELGEWVAHQGMSFFTLYRSFGRTPMYHIDRPMFDLPICLARCASRISQFAITRYSKAYGSLHAVVEQYQTLTKFVALVQASEPGKPPLCNLQSCPTMSAGG